VFGCWTAAALPTRAMSEVYVRRRGYRLRLIGWIVAGVRVRPPGTLSDIPRHFNRLLGSHP
jgi:hypothetical protein